MSVKCQSFIFLPARSDFFRDDGRTTEKDDNWKEIFKKASIYTVRNLKMNNNNNNNNNKLPIVICLLMEH